LTPKTVARKVARLALTKKAHDVQIMDLRKLTDIADFFVIGTADSDVQVKAVADAVADGMEHLGVPLWHREGISQRQWVLLDYVDVVVHIFHRETRAFYSLDKLWGDAAVEIIEDDAPKKKPARRKTPAKTV